MRTRFSVNDLLLLLLRSVPRHWGRSLWLPIAVGMHLFLAGAAAGTKSYYFSSWSITILRAIAAVCLLGERLTG